MTLQDLINRITLLANESGMYPPDEEKIPWVQPAILTEVVLPRVLEILIDEACESPEGLKSVRKSETVSIVSGQGAMPPGYLEKWAEAFDVRSGSTVSVYSLESDYYSFLADDVTAIPKFYIENSVIYTREAGGNPGASSTDVTINGPRVPNIPRSSVGVSGISGTTITTDAAHGLSDGDTVIIYGVPSNVTGANGTHVISSASGSTFDIPTAPSGTFTKGGTVLGPPDFTSTHFDLPDFLLQKLTLIIAGLVTSNISPLEYGLNPDSRMLRFQKK